jgi:hypothetical protein
MHWPELGSQTAAWQTPTGSQTTTVLGSIWQLLLMQRSKPEHKSLGKAQSLSALHSQMEVDG